MLWKNRTASVQGFSPCRSDHMSGVVDSHGCCKFNHADLALGPRDSSAHLPVFLHLRTTNFPGPDSITRSEQAQQRRLERKATKHERRQCRRRLSQPSSLLMCLYRSCGKTQRVQTPCRDSSLMYLTVRIHTPFQYGNDEADEGEVAQQDHMSAHNLTLSAVTSELRAGQFCSPIALTLGRFASSSLSALLFWENRPPWRKQHNGFREMPPHLQTSMPRDSMRSQ